MIEAPVALAFTAGMLAVLNPCGFAMLPAYLSFFLVGDRDETHGAVTSVRRALLVASSVSVGFALLFAVIGLAVRHLTSAVLDYSPWASVVIGVALLGFGVSLLLGMQPKLRVRGFGGGRAGTPQSMALYGASYGVVSLGCTLPTFLVYVAGTLTQESLVSGAAVFVAYALGFAALLTSLTIALALARRSLLGRLRRALPLVQRVSGALLMLAGTYVIYYGWYELHRFGDRDALIERVTRLSADLQGFVMDLGGKTLGLLLATFVMCCAAWVLWRPSDKGIR